MTQFAMPARGSRAEGRRGRGKREERGRAEGLLEREEQGGEHSGEHRSVRMGAETVHSKSSEKAPMLDIQTAVRE